MPLPVPECPGVFHCGFHSEKSFGATSYLLQRAEGNILMDAPRFNPMLAKRIEALGGVSTIVLSHMCATPSVLCHAAALHTHVVTARRAPHLT